MRPFSISEAEIGSGCREIRVEGELDLSVADQLQRRFDAAAGDGVEVLVSLERCDFIDSTGIAAIVLGQKLLESRGLRLLICNPSGQVSRILAITGLDGTGLVCPSSDEALTQLGHPVG